MSVTFVTVLLSNSSNVVRVKVEFTGLECDSMGIRLEYSWEGIAAAETKIYIYFTLHTLYFVVLKGQVVHECYCCILDIYICCSKK